MTNIEKNAIDIAKLLGYKNIILNQDEAITKFSSYNRLMPIVFECRRTDSKYFISIGNDYIALDSHISGWINEKTVVYNRDSETEFIEAIQLAVIKYLEMKNGNPLGS